MSKNDLTKILMLMLMLAWLTGCEEKIDYAAEARERLGFDVDKDLQSALQENRMPLLAGTLGCNACHALDHKLVGPAWQDVGKRYRGASTFEYQGKNYPVTEGLVRKISHGGSGNWGVEAMPALDTDGSRQAQIEKLVGFILQLGKQ